MAFFIASPNDLRLFDSLKRFMRFLSVDPTPNEICQYVVLNWPLRPAALFAGLRLVSIDAQLPLVGYFGAPIEQVRPYLFTSLWDDAPAAKAVRDRSSVICATRNEIKTKAPLKAETFPTISSFVALPLLGRFNVVGTMELAFSEELVDSEEILVNLSLFSDVLTFYATSWSGKNSVSTNLIDEHDHSVTQTRREDSDAVNGKGQQQPLLSHRQISTLALISEGFTNRRIAHRLGFSDSTIRQETITIYAILNVKTRKEAVEKAFTLGMIGGPGSEEIA